jgi:hypothetical protein
MAASYRSEAHTALDTAQSTLTINKPTGTVDGDVLVAFILASDATFSSEPSGWTQVGSQLNVNAAAGSPTYARLRAYVKAASGEPSDYAWGMSASDNHIGAIVAVQGADISSIVDASGTQANVTDDLTIVLPSISPGTAGDLLLACVAQANLTTFAPAGGMTERVDDAAGSTFASGRSLHVATEALASSGATGTRTVTDENPQAAFPDRLAGFLIAIKAATTPVSVTAPTISGTPTQGQTLTLTDGDGAEDWTGETSIARQWQRADNAGFSTNLTDIGSATNATYVLQAADVGKYVRCRVRGTNANGNTDAFSNGIGTIAGPPAAPTNVTPDSIGGLTQRGATLTVTNGDGPEDWTDETSIAIQWRKADNLAFSTNVADIAGATGATHVLGSGEAGKYVRARVRATNITGSTDSNSNIVGPISDPAAPVNTVAPVITDPAPPLRIGDTLSCTQGSWSNSPLAYAYQWQRADTSGGSYSNISGATGASYVIQPADQGKFLRCQVSATNANG